MVLIVINLFLFLLYLLMGKIRSSHRQQLSYYIGILLYTKSPESSKKILSNDTIY